MTPPAATTEVVGIARTKDIRDMAPHRAGCDLEQLDAQSLGDFAFLNAPPQQPQQLQPQFTAIQPQFTSFNPYQQQAQLEVRISLAARDSAHAHR